MASNGPLSPDDLTVINESLAALKQAKDEIKRAKLAGIDVSDQEAEVDRLEAQLKAIKSAYFPSTPRG